MDIITVQSVCRRKLGRLEFERMLERMQWNHAVSLIRGGLEIMGIDFGNRPMELEMPSPEVLEQMALLLTSLRVED